MKALLTRLVSRKFSGFSFATSLRKRKNQHDCFGDDEPHCVDDEPLQDNQSADSDHADEPLDEDHDAVTVDDGGEVGEEQRQVAFDEHWKTFLLEPWAKLKTSPAPSSPHSQPRVERPLSVRQIAKNAKKALRRSSKRKDDATDRHCVSTAPKLSTAPLSSSSPNLVAHAVRLSISKRHGHPLVQSIRDANLRTHATKQAWLCRYRKKREGPAPTFAELKRMGYKLISFPLNETRCLLDAEGRIIVVMAGFPHDKPDLEGWQDCIRECSAAFSNERTATAGLKEDGHTRGNFVSINAGVTHNNGTERPINRVFRPKAAGVIAENLLANSRIKRVAGYQDFLLHFYAPKLASYYDTALTELYVHDRTLRRPFHNSSYPCVTFNIDSKTVCKPHIDGGNFPANLCAITSFGNYNPKVGGHLVLYDLKVIIEFPPGSTCLIPSGSIRHGNTAIQAGETRFSMIQYCPGGLLRWVAFGFRKVKDVVACGGEAARLEIDGKADERWEWVINRLSKLEELEKDQAQARTKAKEKELLSD